MKKLTALLPGLLIASVFASLFTLSTGCIVRPIGGGYYHHHHHRGW